MYGDLNREDTIIKLKKTSLNITKLAKKLYSSQKIEKQSLYLLTQSLDYPETTPYEKNIFKKLQLLEKELQIIHEMESSRIDKMFEITRGYLTREKCKELPSLLLKTEELLKEIKPKIIENNVYDDIIKLRRMHFKKTLFELRNNPVLNNAKTEYRVPKTLSRKKEIEEEKELKLWTDPPTRTRKYDSDMITHKPVQELMDEIYIKKQRGAFFSRIDDRSPYYLENKDRWQTRINPYGGFYYSEKDKTEKIRNPKKEIKSQRRQVFVKEEDKVLIGVPSKSTIFLGNANNVLSSSNINLNGVKKEGNGNSESSYTYHQGKDILDSSIRRGNQLENRNLNVRRSLN